MIDRDRWLGRLEELKRRGEAEADSASDQWRWAYRNEIFDVLHRMPGRELWVQRLEGLPADTNPYEYDPRFEDETGERPPDSSYGGIDTAAIQERYWPWSASRWTRDYATFLGRLIDSERQAKTLETPRWLRIWRAAPDQALAQLFVVLGTVLALVIGAFVLRAFGFPG